jgi:hypothetical protein
MGEVTSLYVVVALLIKEAWVLLYESDATKPKKSLQVWLIPLKGYSLCFLYPTCRALWVSRCFFVHSSNVLLASSFLFLDMGLPSTIGMYKLVHCILTKVSKSMVCMTNN